MIRTDFTERGKWAQDLLRQGFDTSVPTVWLLEGLLMYLPDHDTNDLMQQIGKLSAPRSVVFHDAISAHYVKVGVVVGGARFTGGSDDYAGWWRRQAGFGLSYVRNFESVRVDRERRRLVFDDAIPEATPQQCRGRDVVLFVQVEKGE